MPEFYVLSFRKVRKLAAQCCLIEFEDVLVKSLNATLVYTEKPFTESSRYLRYINKIFDNYSIQIPPKKKPREPQILIVVALILNDFKVMEYISNWRQRFDLVCVYIFDSHRTNFKFSKFSRMKNTINNFDYVFLPMSLPIPDYRKTFKTNIEMVPMAADVLQFGKLNQNRFIHLIGYGRQLPSACDLFESEFNQTESDRIFYYTNHITMMQVNDFYKHRRFFWKILNNSHLALAYDNILTHPQRFHCSFVGQRYFECLAAGCVIIGRAPTCPEVKELLNWEYATLEVPNDDKELIPWVEDLLRNKSFLATVHHLNYYNALAYHDWRYRVSQMLNIMNLDQPESLQKELSKLEVNKERLREINY